MAAAKAQLISHIGYDVGGHFIVYGEGFRLVSDEAGGAIVVWEDYRNAFWDTTPPSDPHWAQIYLYGQRLAADGSLLWPGGTSGLAIQAGDSLDHANATICPIGSGDILVTWEDNRNLPASGVDIFARRVNADGTMPWASSAVAVCNAPNEQWSPVIAADSAGGGIIVWRDHRNKESTGWDIYAQRINGDGVLQWAGDAAVCIASGDQTDKFVITAGDGGAIAAWVDERDSGDTGKDLYCQRINADGSMAWAPDGVGVCTAVGDQYNMQLYPDQLMGLLVVWQDYRSAGAADIYAQRIGQDGLFKWALNGEEICTAGG